MIRKLMLFVSIFSSWNSKSISSEDEDGEGLKEVEVEDDNAVSGDLKRDKERSRRLNSLVGMFKGEEEGEGDEGWV